MSVVLIVGASRGIGWELVCQYVESGARVIATVRNAEARDRVQALGAEVHLIDVAQPTSVSGLAWLLDGEKIDIALYVAGVKDGPPAKSPPTQEQFDRVMHTNVLGVMQVIPQVAPMVENAGGVLGVVSSELSLLSGADGYEALYRVSKAAVNMVVASAQAQWPQMTVVALDPGWVQTAMGGAQAPLAVEDSVRGLIATLATVTPADGGHLLRHDGARVPY